MLNLVGLPLKRGRLIDSSFIVSKDCIVAKKAAWRSDLVTAEEASREACEPATWVPERGGGQTRETAGWANCAEETMV